MCYNVYRLVFDVYFFTTANDDCYTLEIYHGGFFAHMPGESKKYKIARFNSLGGKLYLDGLDPDKISWVEINNIAWDLGYREKPISYCYKLPGTLSGQGWVALKSDADVIEMMKMLPAKKRQISMYITGGGKRKKRDAELDDLISKPVEWQNPLNDVGPVERRSIDEDANMVGRQLNTVAGGVGVNEETTTTYILYLSETAAANGVSGGDFLFQDSDINKMLNEGQTNHCNEVENVSVQKVIDEITHADTLQQDKEVQNINEDVAEVVKITKATRIEKAKGKLVETDDDQHVGRQKARKPSNSKYDTRFKGKKKMKSVGGDDDDSSGDSDFYVDSDYDQQEADDDSDFVQHVDNPNGVEEFEEMGFKGLISDDEDNTDELESLSGSETEEDEQGNPIPKRERRGPKCKAWNRSRC